MARSRRVSDDEILGAALATVIERGPTLTLAEVGEKVGLSAATVVQRFGSKRELMLGVARLWADRAATPIEGDGGPIEQLLECTGDMSEWMKTPRDVANVTASMHIDLADAEFREVIVGCNEAHRRRTVVALDEAIEAGELKPCDTEQLARLIQVAGHGALQSWALEPDGELGDWVVRCLKATIAPWRLDPSEADYESTLSAPEA